MDAANHTVRIHDKSCSLRHSVWRQNSQLSTEIFLDVGKHGKRQIIQLRVMCAPRAVHPFGVSAAAKNLGVALFELIVKLAECDDFRGTKQTEVRGPEKINFPLAGIVEVGDGPESLAQLLIAADCGIQ